MKSNPLSSSSPPPPPPPLIPMLLCSVCAHPSSSQCSRCKDALFCGAECQRKAWPTHKEICNKVEQLHDAEKTAYVEKLEEQIRVRMIKIAHFDQCVLIEIAATLALNQFQQRYTPVMIINDPLLRAEEILLTEAKTKAWNDRFAAESAAYLPTLASILWIVAKSGFTEEVAPFLNLSKATRECKNLHRYMREVMNWQNDDYVYTQLHFFAGKALLPVWRECFR